MKYNLLLDDFRTLDEVKKYTSFENVPNNQWILCLNYNEFVDCIQKNGLPEFICFDHDLHDQHYNSNTYNAEKNVWEVDYNKYTEKTGLDCAKFIVELCMDKKLALPNYLVHSMNPNGKLNIISYLESYIKHCKLNES